MAKVQNSTNIFISKQIGNLIFLPENTLFNGYVYNLSLTVGLNGSPSILILNLALNKTLKNVAIRDKVITQRKQDINTLSSSKNLTQALSVSDKDFDLKEMHMGSNVSYTITIPSNDPGFSYTLRNFKIISYAINQKDNEKILTLTLHDNSLVLDKIYVGLLGQHIALDARSEKTATIDKIVIHCPSVNYSDAMMTTKTNFEQQMHVVDKQLFEKLRIAEDFEKTFGNYITIQGKSKNFKSIHDGYGAVILLGEEEFKDAPCATSEVTYTFETLIAAMKELGIVIKNDLIKDKSKGKIKKNFSGTLKDVLNQWCDEYSYSYLVDTSITSDKDGAKIFIKGIDLSTDVSAKSIIATKLLMEDLDAGGEIGEATFVIRSQTFDYDLSQKKLKLYSSYYHKEARDKTHSFEQNLTNLPFYSMNLRRIFPNWFGTINTTDFCGAQRSFDQVLTSAVLGKFSPSLRQIYNYQIGAFKALGFTHLSNAAIQILNNKDLMIEEAITTVMEMHSALLFDAENDGAPIFNFNFGFYNQKAVSQIQKIEDYIADFIGKHYWTDFMIAPEGSSANKNLFNEFSITTLPNAQKVYFDQIHNLPIIKEGEFITQQLAALYNGQENYSKAFAETDRLAEQAKAACDLADPAYIQRQQETKIYKSLAFYAGRDRAAYGVFQELIRELEILEYSIGNNNNLFQMPLSDIFSPTFKELSPSTIGLLQAVLPVNVANMTLGDHKFGILACVNNQYQIFNITQLGSKTYPIYNDGGLLSNFKTPEVDAVFVNPVEFQNQIRDFCNTIGELNTKNISIIKGRVKNSCSKTILYQICILPAEVDKINTEDQAATQFAIGPSPSSCRRIKITRGMPWKALVASSIRKLILAGNVLVEDSVQALGAVNVHGVRLGGIVSYLELLVDGTTVWETITLPAQGTYELKLISKTKMETFVPSQQFVKGGLEDANDIKSIIENEGFSVDLFLNNITPNVRELFGDQSTPQLISETVSDTLIIDPIVMGYKGYKGDNPLYEFNTFSDFHNSLKTYYDNQAISVSGPGLSYSADLFCSTISEKLGKILSVDNGLVGLNMTLGEGGLNIRCEFNSRPVKEVSMRTLLYKNKPNIKFQNMNSLT